MTPSPFLESFPHAAPVFAMLHLKGAAAAERFDIARREIDILSAGGVDAVVVENYYGDVDDVVAVCDYLRSSRPDVTFGVNILRDDWKAFEVADEFGARFVQLDSVAGHLSPEDEAGWLTRFNDARARSKAFVLGGVRFKYQDYASGRPLEVDLALGVERSDGIVVTGEGTGIETPLEKLAEFRSIVGESVPLVVGAGITPHNLREQLTIGDAVIVGSYFKDTYQDTGDVDAEHVAEFMKAVTSLRAELGVRA